MTCAAHVDDDDVAHTVHAHVGEHLIYAGMSRVRITCMPRVMIEMNMLGDAIL